MTILSKLFFGVKVHNGIPDFPDFGQTRLYDADDDGDYDIFPLESTG